MSKPSLLKWFVSIIFVLALFISSCADQTDEANKLIDKANKHIDKQVALQKEINKLESEISSLPATPESLKKIIELGREEVRKLEEQKKEVKEAQKLFTQIKKLDVSKEFKKFADIKFKAGQATIEMTDANIALNQEAIKFGEVSLAGITEEQEAVYTKTLDELENKVDALKKKADKLDEEADKYFEEQELGG